MSRAARSGDRFGRLRPRAPQPPGDPPALPRPGEDVEGRRALFSDMPAVPTVPAFGSVSVTCSSCGSTSVLSLLRAVRAAVPSLHVPLRRYPSWLRCPACGRRTWTRLALHL